MAITINTSKEMKIKTIKVRIIYISMTTAYISTLIVVILILLLLCGKAHLRHTFLVNLCQNGFLYNIGEVNITTI